MTRSGAPQNRLRQTWAEDAVAVGAFAGIPHPSSCHVLAAAGLDFVVLDAQHGAATLHSLPELIAAVEQGGAAPVVRVPRNDSADIMRVLDLGAAGVIIPMVNSRDDAVAAVEACRYPPLGTRSFGQLQGNRYGGIAGANREVVCIPMIETAAAIANIDDIVEVDGVDAIFIGPIDLQLSLGLELDFSLSDPALRDAAARVVDACRTRCRPVGIPAMAPDHVERFVQDGYGFITIGADAGFLRQGAAREVDRFRSIAETASRDAEAPPTHDDLELGE
jgi:4-hydroxy-2-oxoheptanedioate aldolase